MLKTWIARTVLVGALISLYGFTPPTECAPCNTSCWSDTDPKINLSHVIPGELNSKNKPVGFHSALGLVCKERSMEVTDPPDSLGVYTAEVIIQGKTKFSSIYPDTYSQQDIINAILEAYNSSDKGGSWQGKTSKGLIIHGYLDAAGNINTAFPIYQQDEELRQ